MMSAMIWQGWVRSVRPLMTGTVACSAQLGQRLVLVGADHDRVDVAREHLGRVGDGLAAADLQVGVVERDASGRRAGAWRRRRTRACASTASRRSASARRPRCRRACSFAGTRLPAFFMACPMSTMRRSVPAVDAVDVEEMPGRHGSAQLALRCARSGGLRLRPWQTRFSARDRRCTASRDLGLGDVERRQQAHDVLAGADGQQLLGHARAPPRRPSAA